MTAISIIAEDPIQSLVIELFFSLINLFLVFFFLLWHIQRESKENNQIAFG